MYFKKMFMSACIKYFFEYQTFGKIFCRKMYVKNDFFFSNIDLRKCDLSANEITLYLSHNLKSKPLQVKVYGLQHWAFVHIVQQAIKGPRINECKPFKQENQWSTKSI